jgi:uncharacterized protein involved in exopolysaccharide biosynthesis
LDGAAAHQLADELEERSAKSRRKVQSPEGRERDDRDPVRAADLPGDGPAADAQRDIGDDDAQIPVLVQQPAALSTCQVSVP